MTRSSGGAAFASQAAQDAARAGDTSLTATAATSWQSGKQKSERLNADLAAMDTQAALQSKGANEASRVAKSNVGTWAAGSHAQTSAGFRASMSNDATAAAIRVRTVYLRGRRGVQGRGGVDGNRNQTNQRIFVLPSSPIAVQSLTTQQHDQQPTTQQQTNKQTERARPPQRRVPRHRHGVGAGVVGDVGGEHGGVGVTSGGCFFLPPSVTWEASTAAWE
jgi:hypothetical protein